MTREAESGEAYRFSASTRSARELEYMTRLERRIEASPFSATERMMNFPLYTPRQDIARFLCKYEIFKRILGVQGSIVECGVFFGGGLLGWAQLSAIFEPSNHQRRVIGFDTFAGFPRLADQDAASESEEAHEKGLAIDSYDEILRCIELFDLNRPVAHVPKIELIRGDACETIPGYVEDNPQLLVSLLYLDFDVYEPTKAALDHLLPRMPKGAVVAFDELNLKDWPGETAAVIESLDLNTLRIERFSFGSTISFAQIGI
jgi:hypothetical protein